MLDMAHAREVFEASEDFTVGIEEEFAILDPQTLALAQRFEELRDAAHADEVLAESVAGELIESEIEIRSGRGETIADADGPPARGPHAPVPRWPPSAGARLAATGTHPVEPLAGAADHRHRPLPARGRGPQVRGLAQQHLQPARARGRARAPTGRSPCATGCGRCCPSCWRSRPTRRSSTAATPACTRRARQIFTKSFPRCGIPDAFGSWARVRRLRGLPGAQRTRSSSTPRSGGACARTTRFGTVEVRICDAQTARRGVHRAGGADHGLRGPGGARLRRGRPVRAAAARAWSRRTSGARSATGSTAS